MTQELKRFRAEKDRVFARDPHSPLTPEQRRTFHGLAYFDENPQLVIHASIDRDVDPEEVRMGTSSGDEQVYHRHGVVRFGVDDHVGRDVDHARRRQRGTATGVDVQMTPEAFAEFDQLLKMSIVPRDDHAQGATNAGSTG